MMSTWNAYDEINRNPANVLEAWNAGDASDWTATTEAEVEQALRDQIAQNSPDGDEPVSDEQFTHDARIIAAWLAEERAN